jgi:hypothetical protein
LVAFTFGPSHLMPFCARNTTLPSMMNSHSRAP